MLALTSSGSACGSYERFLWAVGTVRARTHAPLDGAASALVPLADLVIVPSRNLFRCTLARGLTAELFPRHGHVTKHGMPTAWAPQGWRETRAALTMSGDIVEEGFTSETLTI